MENLFAKLGQEWDSFTVSPLEFYDAGEAVFVEGRYSGSYKATGKSIDAQFCHVLKLREGKVTSFQQYLDTARMQDVMGARLETQEAFRRSSFDGPGRPRAAAQVATFADEIGTRLVPAE